MSSPMSDNDLSPSRRKAFARREVSAPPCTICDSLSHDVDACPHATAFRMRASLRSGSPVCVCCKSPLHNAEICPHVLAKQAAHLHHLEPVARFVLKTGVPQLANFCTKHSQMDQDTLANTVGLILQHRALMPMCVSCVLERQQDFEIENAAYRSSIDSCKLLETSSQDGTANSLN